MASIQKNQIEYILTLAETGNFSESADKCFVTQSTLSTMIKKYEEQIGFKIFNRKTKPVSLTQEGEAIIKQLKSINQEYENLEEVVRTIKGELHGLFRIGVIPTVAPFLLPRFLNRVVHQYPNIKFSVHEITTEEIVKKIKQRDLDAGIVSTPLLDNELREEPLFVEDFVVYDTRKSVKGKQYSVSDIDLDRLWLLEEGHCMRNQVGKICNLRKKRKVKNNLIYNSGSILSLIEFVKISKGITLLPRLAIESNPLLDMSCVYSLAAPIPIREIGLITHNNFAKQRFLKIIAAEITTAVETLISPPKQFDKIAPF